jgi:hypothetical protein
MSMLRVQSDQLLMWSAQNVEETRYRPQESSQTPAAKAASSGEHPAGLSHRTLQTLRQTRVQMRQGSRARSQVLPVGELSRQSPADGLRSSIQSRRHQQTHSQLSSDPRDLGGDLRDQSRTSPASRGALRTDGEPSLKRAHRLRFANWRRASRQHAHGLVRSRVRVASQHGGRQ